MEKNMLEAQVIIATAEQELRQLQEQQEALVIIKETHGRRMLMEHGVHRVERASLDLIQEENILIHRLAMAVTAEDILEVTAEAIQAEIILGRIVAVHIVEIIQVGLIREI